MVRHFPTTLSGLTKGAAAVAAMVALPVSTPLSGHASEERQLPAPLPVPEEVLRSLQVDEPTAEVVTEIPLAVDALNDLSMEKAVRLSIERNPKLKSSYWTFRSTQDLMGAAYAAWWPQLSLKVGSGIYKYDSNTSGASTNYSELTSLFSSLSSPSSYSTAAAGTPTSSNVGTSNSTDSNKEKSTSASNSGSTTSSSSSSGGQSSFDASSISSAFESISGQPNGNYFYSTFNLSLTWDVLNATRSLNIWKSKHQALQGADRYAIAYRDNVLNVQNSYVDLLASTAKKNAYEYIVANSQRLVEVTDDKREFGIASGLDVAKQKTNYFSDLSLLEQSKRDIKTNQANLARLMSVNAFEDITLSENLRALGGWSHPLDETIKASESHRKVVQEMLLDVYLQDVDADIEMASYLPTLQLVSQLYGTQTGYWTESYAEFIKNPSAVLTFSWKFFDGGQARMRAESYRKLSESAYQTYLETINQVKENARSGYSKVNVGREILLASSDQVKQASTSLRLQSDRYQIGYGTVTDLVQAQTTLAQAVLSYINQLQDYNKALLELARNTGLTINQDPELIDRIGDPLASLNDLSFSADL